MTEPATPGKTVHQIEVFADNFQIQIQDQIEECEYPESWNDCLLTQLYVCGDRILGIGTVRDLDCELTLEIFHGAMDEKEQLTDPDLNDYDHAVQCTMDIPSGKLLITGCSSDYDECAKIELPKGTYGVRIFWSGLDTTDELGFEGDDRYTVQLYPDTHFEERILKPWRQLAYQLNPQNN